MNDPLQILVGDCRDVMNTLPPDSIDAIVTDPPYELNFMNREWDRSGVANDVATWAAAFRVLKPGGHVLSFGGSRTYHRMAVAIEDAGFEIRDQIMWLYGSGFPKNHDISKSIDKQKHNRDEVLEITRWIAKVRDAAGVKNTEIDDAFGYRGMANHWTTQATQPHVPTLDQVPTLLKALKNPEIPRRIEELLVTLNADKYDYGENWYKREVTGQHASPAGAQTWKANYENHVALEAKEQREIPATENAAKWQGWGTALKPAHEPIAVARKPFIGTTTNNVLEYGTGAYNIEGTKIGDELMPEVERGAAGVTDFASGGDTPERFGRWPANLLLDQDAALLLDKQSEASRFFYTAKTSVAEREAGMDSSLTPGSRENDHPTVKPVDVMRWLVRLVTPPDGVVLDPFTGSGSTGMAALDEGFRFIGIELNAGYADISRKRIEHRHILNKPESRKPTDALPQGRLF